MSELVHVDLPEGPFVKIAAGSGGSSFVALYDKPLPTNIQPGESWTFERISARFRAIVVETEKEKGELTDEETIAYATAEEAAHALASGPVSIEESVAAGINNPFEKKKTSFARASISSTENKITTTTSIRRSIFPCPATALVELYDMDGTVASMTIDGTFRWFFAVGETFNGQCEFSGFSDLTNPPIVYIEKVSLRISLFVPLSAACEALLKSTTSGLTGTSGAIDLAYAKEVK